MMERAGRLLFRWRSFTPVLLVLVAVPLLWRSRGPASPLWLAFGLVLCVAGQALRAWTWGSAYASRQEHVKGSVAPGLLADLVVLSEDPTAVSPDRIAGLEVLATIVGGQFGYGSLD